MSAKDDYPATMLLAGWAKNYDALWKEIDDLRSVKGFVIVVDTRLAALKKALDALPARSEDVEFQYDRVLSAVSKMVQAISP